MMKNKYLIVLLCDSSVSFCHYSNHGKEKHLIDLRDLKKAILYAMKEGAKIQFIYPDYSLPEEYKKMISSVGHIKIKPFSVGNVDNDEYVHCFDSIRDLCSYKHSDQRTVAILRIRIKSFIEDYNSIINVLPQFYRINIVFSDIPELDDTYLTKYKEAIEDFSKSLTIPDVKKALDTEINIVTDRLILTAMHNCNAGTDSLTVAPDGRFYICPGFYYDGFDNVGTLDSGPIVPNRQLYRIESSPICRVCDAYHCHRCVWLNGKLTMEVNIPGKQQCVISHHERNATRKLLMRLQNEGSFISNEHNIDEIDYIDPFEKVKLKI